MKNTIDQFTTPADDMTTVRTRGALAVARRDETLAKAINDALAAVAFLQDEAEHELHAQVSMDAYNALRALTIETANRRFLKEALRAVTETPLIEVGLFTDEELAL